MKRLLLVLIIGAASVGGWWVGRQSPHGPVAASVAADRKPLFFQSPMHPWIKSDKPGNCTICGMKLVAVFEGESAREETGSPVGVRLNPKSVSVIEVDTAKVRRAPLRRSLRVSGTIDDDDTRHRRLSSYLDGRIDRLMVNFTGAEVTKGQPLASIYSPALLTARDEYLLLLRQPALPQRERLLEAARSRLIRMGLTAEQVERLPDQKGSPNSVEILAPISGTVVERNIYEGQYVKEGDVLFEIADFNQMWFKFDAYERDLAWIRVGQSVEVTTPSAPGQLFTAPVAFIDPNLMPQTRSAKVRVVLENPMLGEPPRRALLHRLYGEARILAEVPDVLVVPRSAVLSPGADPVVYLARGPAEYEPRRVHLGRAGDEFWEVLDGLNEGDSVVTTGNLLIDAQAQLEKGPSEQPLAAPSRQLTEAQREAAQAFLSGMDGVAAALSSDDLSGFNAQIKKVPEALQTLTDAFGADVQAIGAAGPFASAFDLAAARKTFYGLSAASARFSEALRRQDPLFASLKVYECPMAKAAVPSASSDKGRWVQLAEPMRNPFFGKEMLDCGTEIKP